MDDTDEDTDADTDTDEAVAAFLERAEAVYGEYDQGYIDADAALRRLRRDIDSLRAARDE